MIKKVLVANRGEIAVRIMRSCREMGIRTVAVFSDADRTSLHVRYADEAYHIGPSPSLDSYLNIEKIIKAAKQSGANAIHPGYGFLSENPEFVKRCGRAGIIFIGPTAHSMSIMGDKITARDAMISAGIPVVPGTREAIHNEKIALKFIQETGFPVIIKAAAGGGGKGMRIVTERSNITAKLRAARSEALNAFGDDSVYIEKYLESPHHIEFQILADKYGNVIHLFERECSVQRRHQKVIEETPSPFITAELREKMGQIAVTAARTVRYEGAGTIEFLVDKDKNFYFLEMNTRLQVEHPITERVVGIDLVKEQIRIARGEKLSFKQKNIRQSGHAIECRIYAEDPGRNFMPSPGLIKHITNPTGLGIRSDGYVYEGYEIPIYYDPLISKLIAWGQNRTEAIKRMKRALYEYKITGVKTTINFLGRIMDIPDFIDGNYDTHFIEKNKELLMSRDIRCDIVCEDIAIIAAYIDYNDKLAKLQSFSKARSNGNSRWKTYGRKKNHVRI
jgi:acetyl-CoA carboxylase, biotin carboxylase subunit